MNNGVAATAVSHEEVKSLRIPDKVSIFTTELVALNLSLDVLSSKPLPPQFQRHLICFHM